MAKSAERVLQILETIAVADEPMSHGDISKALNIPKSSLTSLLRDLTETEYLEVSGSGAYELGRSVLVLGHAFLKRYDPIKSAAPYVEELSAALGETTHISVRDGSDVIVVQQGAGRFTLVAILRVGQRAPAVATAAGKALISHMAEHDIGAMVAEARAQRLIGEDFDEDAFATELEGIRNGGIARVDSAYIEGVSAFAVPLIGLDAPEPFAALSVVVPVNRLTDELADRVMRELKRVRSHFGGQVGQ